MERTRQVPKNILKPDLTNPQLDYAHAGALAQTQASETLNPNQEAIYRQASSRTIAFQIGYLADQRNKNVPFTVVTKEEVAGDANVEKKAEFDSRPASKQPIETESAPSTPSIPSIPKNPTFPKLPKVFGQMGMGESRWAKEDASPTPRKSRRGGRNSRHDLGGSRSGGHSPASSQQGSIVSLPQSQEEKFNRNQGRAQESSNWGDNPAGAGGTNGGGWGSDLIPTLPPRDEAYIGGSDCITEETKQLKDGRGTDSVPTGKTQPQVDGNNWGADTVPAEIKRELGTKERSHDWGAKTGHDDYSHSRPVRDSRGAHDGNLQYGRLNRDFDESSSGWNSPSVHKHLDENNGWDTGTSQTKHSKPVASDDLVTTGLADFSPSSARSGRGGDHGDYSRGGGGGPLGRGSWNGVAQSAYNRSTDAAGNAAGIEPAWSGQGNTAPSWGDDSNFAPPKKSQHLNDSYAGHPDVPKRSQDVEPPGPAQESTSAWDDKPGWRPSRFKKHEPKW